MFEAAEIGHRIPPADYKKAVPALRADLLKAQYELLEQGKFPVIVLVNGVDGAGKGETVNLLNEWMDPRHIRTEAFGALTDAERVRPEMWRFWQVLPAKGRIGILFGSWYTDPILARVMDHEKEGRFSRRMEDIRRFERMLVAEGALLVKFWFHLSKSAARKRFKTLQEDPRTAWRVTQQDWEHLKQYDHFIGVCEEALRRTDTGEAPWLVIEGSDPAYRSLTAGEYLLEALKARLTGPREKAHAAAPPPPPIDKRTLLASFDYERKLADKAYKKKLEDLQGRLNMLMREPGMASRSLVLVFEGMDAAGKGSTIRRLTQAMDARNYRVVPIAAPSEEERAQPYLWRFWRHVPPHGHTVIFDRSWYGRVLVERVEKFCAEADWMRAYDEINAFEEQMSDAGAVVIKFWLAITPQEQLRRFKERQAIEYKNFKITDEDWRNREKWPHYERAVGDMIERTSTTHAPWQVIASNDKLFSRIEVLETVCDRLEEALGAKKKKRRKAA